MNPSFELYCRLYIHGPEDEKGLRDEIRRFIGGSIDISGAVVRNPVMHMHIYRSDTFDPEKVNDPDGFLHYRYSAEVSPIDEIDKVRSPVSREEYLQLLTGLISHLRKNGAKVVAACDFDEIIVKATGWNWSEESQIHP